MADPIPHRLRDGRDVPPFARQGIAVRIQQAAGIDFWPDVHVGIGEVCSDDFVNDAARVSA
jgi:hypothetical protein